MDQPVFFIIGIARSGTTLLERILDNHTEIAVCPETDAFVYINRLNAKKRFLSKWHYTEFLKGVNVLLSNFQGDAGNIVAEQLYNNEIKNLSTSNALQSLTKELLQRSGKSLFGEKTPRHLFYVDQIKSICPYAKFILIIRNPLDTVCSLSRLHALKEKNETYCTKNLLRSSMILKRGLREIKKQINGMPSNIHRLNYEDLVQEPENEMKKICQFLNLHYEDTMLNYNLNTYFNTERSVLRDIVHKRLKEPINTSGVEHYKTVLDKKKINLIFNFLKRELEHFSYEYESNEKLSTHNQLHLIKYNILYFLKPFWWSEKLIKLKYIIKSFLK